jgi:transglycosylase-like protein with SLT domain/peptidase M23-like protein
MTPHRGATRRGSRKRFAAGLCAVGAVAVAFGGNLLAAGAQEAAAPSDSVSTAPTQSSTPAPAKPAPHADSGTTSTTDTTATTPSTTTTTTPATTTTTPSTTSTQTTPTTTQTTAEAPAEHPTGTATTEPAPAPAEAQQQTAPAAPSAPDRTAPKALPFGTFAGPAITSTTAQCRGSSNSAKAAKARRPEAIFRGGGPSPLEPAEACDKRPAHSQNTISPERLDAHALGEVAAAPLRDDQGVPTVTNPTTSLALPGPVPVGVPNFFIDKFRIPPFLLPIYQAAGIEYGVRWEVLAAINEIETDYGRNLNISSAGALGWMQFLPQTWELYGTDANHDGRRDPFNPADAIFAAARYLKAAGADQDLRKAIFAYNHADWYVESVLMRARLIGGLPVDLVGSLSGLTQGHFPVFAKARYADDIAERQAAARAAVRKGAAAPVASDAARRGIDIFATTGAAVIAVQDGTITAIGQTRRLGRYVKLRDVYGNTYTYAHLKKVATRVPVPKAKTQSKASIARELALPQRDPAPTRAATAGTHSSKPATATDILGPATDPAAVDAIVKQRLFAHPGRPNPLTNGGQRQIFELGSSLGQGETLKSYFTGPYGLGKRDVVLKRLAPGRRVIAGTILGRIGKTSEKVAPRLYFEIRPAGRGAPRIDPKPILDGWKLLESTAIYRAQGKNPLIGGASIGQIMLMSKEALAQRVLSNPRIETYSCGRRDIEAGIIDRRVLATLEFLAASGLKPTVTSLTCGHGYYTASGNVSEHSSGNAVDIAKINGIPILGHQGDGSIADIAIRRLLTLQGTMKPHQIISLMTYAGTDNTLALPDHADHIHVGFQPQYQPGTPQAGQLDAVLKPAQWIKLIDRLGHIDNPTVSLRPSKYAVRLPVTRASAQHRGE